MQFLRFVLPLTLLLVSGCAAPPAQSPPPPPAPATAHPAPPEPSPAPAAPAPVTRTVRLDGRDRQVVVEANANGVHVRADAGRPFPLHADLRVETVRVSVVGDRHLLVSGSTRTNPQIVADVLAVSDEGLSAVGDMWGDAGVRVEGDRVVVGRWSDAGHTRPVAYTYGFDSVAGAYVEVPTHLTQYHVLSSTPAPLADDPQAVAHLVQRYARGTTEAAVGVVVESRGRLLMLHPPGVHAGLMGPDYTGTITALDADRDGKLEYIVGGPAGAYNYGLWTYQYAPTQERFTFLDEQMGFREITLVEKADATYFQVIRRSLIDHSTSTVLFTWKNGHFVQVP